MTYYQTLGIESDATAEEIHLAYERLLAATSKEDELLAIKEAYHELSNPFRRGVYDTSLYCKEFIRTMDKRPFSVRKDFKLIEDPQALNHYEYINHLFMTEQGHAEYLTPGQPLSDWDRNRIYWQLHVVSGTLHAKSEPLKRIREKSGAQQKRLDLLLRNERKMAQASSNLTAGHNEQCLYDLSLGPQLVPHTDEMREIAQLISGWEKMAEFAKRHPDLSSANALFAMRKAGCLNPASFSLFMTCENPEQFREVSDVLNTLAVVHLLNLTNFQQLMRHKKYALAIVRGLRDLGFGGLLNQQTFEILLSVGEQAGTVSSGWRYLKEYNLLNVTNRERILALGREGKPIGGQVIDATRRLVKDARLTLEDGLVFQWTGDTPELQVLSSRIDEMFAYGLNLLGEDEDKAHAVFLLALELKKSLQAYFSKPQEEQLRTASQFKTEFRQRLHSQDELMSEHRTAWKSIVANIAIAFTGIGLLVLGAYFLHSGHCFFAKTQRENLRDAVEDSPWLQEGAVLG